MNKCDTCCTGEIGGHTDTCTECWKIEAIESKPKHKFYRRKWIMWTDGSIDTNPHFYPTKSEFDIGYEFCATKSNEWEETEIEM